MNKFVLIAGMTGLVALAGCSQTEEAPPVDENAAAMNEMAPVDTAADDSLVGTYDVKMADGTMGTTVINADGTYVDTGPDGEVVNGTFARKDGKDCFDPEGDDPEVCWTPAPPAADGSFTATSPDGTVVTVTRKAD